MLAWLMEKLTLLDKILLGLVLLVVTLIIIWSYSDNYEDPTYTFGDPGSVTCVDRNPQRGGGSK